VNWEAEDDDPRHGKEDVHHRDREHRIGKQAGCAREQPVAGRLNDVGFRGDARHMVGSVAKVERATAEYARNESENAEQGGEEEVAGAAGRIG